MAIDQSIWIGFDPNEAAAFAVAKHSIERFGYFPIRGLVLSDLRERGLYWRDTEIRINSEGRKQPWDVISDWWMSTEFAISRFLTPHLAETGWALFIDSDVMLLRDPWELFACGDKSKAVMCVKHDHRPANELKMGGLVQASYSRKNWSSVVLWNVNHPSNRKLTVEMVNTLPGRELHRFCWLKDEEIGELPPEWNYLVGHSKLNGKAPALVHFTAGLPDVPGYEKQEFADEWRKLVPHAVGAL